MNTDKIYEPVRDPSWANLVNVRIPGISEPQRRRDIYELRTAIFNFHAQIKSLVWCVSSCRRYHYEVSGPTAHVKVKSNTQSKTQPLTKSIQRFTMWNNEKHEN